MAGYAVGVAGMVKINIGPGGGKVAVIALAGPVTIGRGMATLAIGQVGMINRYLKPAVYRVAS